MSHQQDHHHDDSSRWICRTKSRRRLCFNRILQSENNNNNNKNVVGIVNALAILFVALIVDHYHPPVIKSTVVTAFHVPLTTPRRRNMMITTTRTTTTRRRSFGFSSSLSLSNTNNNNNENNNGKSHDSNDDKDILGPEPLSQPPPPARQQEKSRMGDYARLFLDKINTNSDDDIDDESSSSTTTTSASSSSSSSSSSLILDDIRDATHLVAIPLDQAYELLIELESVQRAILYHCPILVDACITPSAIRLPLLYVEAPSSSTSTSGTSTSSFSMAEDTLVTSTISGIVQQLVDKHIFASSVLSSSSSSAAADKSREQNDIHDDDDDGSDDGVLNSDGYQPLSLTFQSLEIDGSNNKILQTVGVVVDDVDDGDDNDHDDDHDDSIFSRDSSYRQGSRLHDFVSELESTLMSKGFKVAYPPDPNHPNNNNDRDESSTTSVTPSSFRPRVAFMELPKSFDEKLTKFKQPDTEISDDDIQFLTAEQGGNGISPMFWCRWWDDVFARNIRLREVGIYPRAGGNNQYMGFDTELEMSSQFYLPYETISLPDGTPNMKKSEKKFQDYQEQRMKEEQENLEREMEPSYSEKQQPRGSDDRVEDTSSGGGRPVEPDILMTKTRERLEKMYLESVDEFDFDNDGLAQNPNEEVVDELTSDMDDNTDDDDDTDSEASTKTDDIDEPLINDWKDRKAVPASDDDYIDDWMKEKIRKAVDSLESVKSRTPVKKDKPPIEDNPIFKAYREGTLNVPAAESTKSSTRTLGPYPGRDHFVGVWQFSKSPTGFDVDDSSEDTSENIVLRVDGTISGGPTLDLETKQKAAGGTWKMIVNGDDDDDVRLRIRLVIPPKKERIMVMEGIVHRIGKDASLSMPSNTFGIPQLEELAKKNSDKNKVQMMSCTGDVHIEDAITKNNRELIGGFSLMKLSGPLDRDQFTITIPKPVRQT